MPSNNPWMTILELQGPSVPRGKAALISRMGCDRFAWTYPCMDMQNALVPISGHPCSIIHAQVSAHDQALARRSVPSLATQPRQKLAETLT